MKKYISLLICLVLVFSLVSCTYTSTDTYSETKYTAQSDETSNKPNNNTSIYSEIIEDYKYLVELRLSEDFEDIHDKDEIKISDTLNEALETADRYYQWSCMIVEMPFLTPDITKDSFGYILLDINGDGIPELFWIREDHSILAIFTYHEDQIILLDAFWSRYDCVITDDGSLYISGSGGAYDNGYEIKTLTSDKALTTKISFGMYTSEEDTEVRYYEWVDNEETSISEERFNELLIEYPFEQSTMWMNTKIINLF